MDYRIITDIQALETVTELESRIWGRAERTLTPSVIMRVTSLNGGVALGAYDGDHMVGMSWAFPIRRGDVWALWSHITGTLPEYRGQGIGLGLKWKQREWALAHGYDSIHWTFDPTRAQNAHFNLHHLGAGSDTFHPNFYGLIRDNLNPGMPTDRLEIAWMLKDARVGALARGESASEPTLDPIPEAFFLDNDGHLHLNELLNSKPFHAFIAVPPDLSGAAVNEVVRWRSGVRAAFQEAFAAGYQAVDFMRHPERCYYILRRNLI